MVSFQHFHLLLSFGHVDLNRIIGILFFFEFIFHVLEFFLEHDHLSRIKFDALIFLVECKARFVLGVRSISCSSTEFVWYYSVLRALSFCSKFELIISFGSRCTPDS